MVRYMRETKAVSAEAPDEETPEQCSRGSRGRKGRGRRVLSRHCIDIIRAPCRGPYTS